MCVCVSIYAYSTRIFGVDIHITHTYIICIGMCTHNMQIDIHAFVCVCVCVCI